MQVSIVIDASDLATILAALRLFQQTYENKDAAAIRDDWDHFEDCAPLGTEDINVLCERINQADIIKVLA